jgi:hypothetical protein
MLSSILVDNMIHVSKIAMSPFNNLVLNRKNLITNSKDYGVCVCCVRVWLMRLSIVNNNMQGLIFICYTILTLSVLLSYGIWRHYLNILHEDPEWLGRTFYIIIFKVVLMKSIQTKLFSTLILLRFWLLF